MTEDTLTAVRYIGPIFNAVLPFVERPAITFARGEAVGVPADVADELLERDDFEAADAYTRAHDVAADEPAAPARLLAAEEIPDGIEPGVTPGWPVDAVSGLALDLDDGARELLAGLELDEDQILPAGQSGTTDNDAPDGAEED